MNFRLTDPSGNPAPYCAIYRYASGSRGYGCAVTSGYNKTVLTTTTAGGFLPFGQDATTTASSSSSSTSVNSAIGGALTNSPTPSMSGVHTTSISGGAIAGAVVGAIIALGILILIIFIFLRRHISKRRRAAEAKRKAEEEETWRNRFVFAQYAKPGSDFVSPSLSEPSHRRQTSDPETASDGGGRAFSPDCLSTPDINQQGPIELSTMQRRSIAGLGVQNEQAVPAYRSPPATEDRNAPATEDQSQNQS